MGLQERMTRPAILNCEDVARYLNCDADPWSERRARRWLAGKVEATGKPRGVKVGGKWFTTPEMLREAAPWAFEDAAERAAERALAGECEECAGCLELRREVKTLERQLAAAADVISKMGGR
jgi:hypothetical protein